MIKKMAFSSILTQKRYFDTFSRKELLKWLLGVIFLSCFIFLPAISLSATIFTDDFNSYNNGDIINQGGWYRNAGWWEIQDTFTKEGAKAVKSPDGKGNVVMKYGDPIIELSEGRISAYIYITAGSDKRFWFVLDNEAGASMVYVDFNPDGKIYYRGEFEFIYFDDIVYDVWQNLEMEWKNTEPPLIDKVARFRLDGKTWTNWDTRRRPERTDYPSKVNLYVVSGTTGEIYVDYISEFPFAPPIVCSDYFDKISCENVGCFWWENLSACLPEKLITETNIFPEIPNPDETIEIYGVDDNLILKGKIEIGWNDGMIWDYQKFSAVFTNLTTGNSFIFEKDLGEVLPNDTINYDENLGKISEILPYYLLGNFEINYKLFGRKLTNPFIIKEILVEGGVIAISEILTPPETELPIFEPDNCEGLGTIETWLCEIKNTFRSIFYPSPEKITQLKNTIELIKNKAPFSYLSATKDLLINVKNGIETSEVNFKVLGQAGILSFAGLDFDVENGSGTENFISFIRKFFTFILLFGLIVWSISFIRKIFK